MAAFGGTGDISENNLIGTFQGFGHGVHLCEFDATVAAYPMLEHRFRSCHVRFHRFQRHFCVPHADKFEYCFISFSKHGQILAEIFTTMVVK